MTTKEMIIQELEGLPEPVLANLLQVAQGQLTKEEIAAYLEEHTKLLE
jgi:hypothetical protein